MSSTSPRYSVLALGSVNRVCSISSPNQEPLLSRGACHPAALGRLAVTAVADLSLAKTGAGRRAGGEAIVEITEGFLRKHHLEGSRVLGHLFGFIAAGQRDHVFAPRHRPR